MFKKYIQSQKRRARSQPTTSNNELLSSFDIFRHSRFGISVLLVCSFLLFTLSPDMLFTYYQISEKEISYALDVICYILYGMSDFIDGIIYILLLEKVRYLLLKKIHYQCSVVQRKQIVTI